MNSRLLVIAIGLILLAGPLAGCIKGKDEVQAANVEQEKADAILGDQGKEKIESVAALIPKNYSFPDQKVLPKQTITIAAKTSSSALGSYEAQRDEGGIDYRSVIVMNDVSAHIPAGQPVEMFIKLFWDGAEANSADLDIAVDVPGTKTTHSNTTEDLNWNYAVKSMVVNTIGVPGQKHEVGVQIAGGAVTEGFDYSLEISFVYPKDVLTPYHPWAFTVPSGASGIILETEKAGGDEHVTAEFLVIDPNDQLVQYKTYNDIDIPTESVFIPTKGPGEYVFYAFYMHGGFLRLKADVPLETFNVRTLNIVKTETVDMSGPAPGVAGKDPLMGGAGGGTIPASDTNPTTVTFDSGSSFPLDVRGFIRGQVNPMAKITLKSPAGEVHSLTSILRYQDEQGTIGYTGEQDNGPNSVFNFKNMQRGAWTAEIVNDGPAEIGHILTTYTR